MKLLGADVTVVDLDTIERLQPLLEEKATELRAAGRRPYIVAPMGVESLSLGAVGYVGRPRARRATGAGGIDADRLLSLRCQHDPGGWRSA